MKSYKVQILFGGTRTELVLSAHGGAQAIVLARKIYPSGTVISAKEVK